MTAKPSPLPECVHRGTVLNDMQLCRKRRGWKPFSACDGCTDRVEGTALPIVELPTDLIQGCSWRGESVHEPQACGCPATVEMFRCGHPSAPRRFVALTEIERSTVPEDLRVAHSCETCQIRHQPATVSGSLLVSIIITVGPGMRKWLPDAIKSCDGQSAEIVIVYDKEQPGSESEGRKIVRGEWGNVQLARRAGMAVAAGSMLLFVDADNALPQGFVRSAADQLQRASLQNAKVAGVYPDISYHDVEWGSLGRRLDPPEWDRGRFERENFVDASTIVWRHALEASWRECVAHERLEDWHMWGQLVGDGWEFRRGRELTLLYRVRGESMSQVEHADSYAIRYSVDLRPITVFVPVARLWAWGQLCEWLRQLPQRCRLVICEGAGDDRLWGRLQRDRVCFDHLRDVRLYRHDKQQLSLGLADADRHQTEAEVHRVVSGIYNRAAQEASTPLMLIIEDDILPQMAPAELIEKLSGGLDERTIAVSGVYRSRYDGNVVAWTQGAGRSLQFVTDCELKEWRYLPVAGTGFGCLLIQREALRACPLSVTAEDPWFDPRFFRKASSLGVAKLCTAVVCQHRNRNGDA